MTGSQDSLVNLPRMKTPNFCMREYVLHSACTVYVRKNGVSVEVTSAV